MIYLIMKMFLYLLVALVAGSAAGWLLRNVAAIRKEDELNKSLAEARGRVPQFESLLRSRDELVKQLRMDLKTQEAKSSDLQESLNTQEREMREKSRALSKAVARNEALEGVSVTGDSDESGTLIEAGDETEVHREPVADEEPHSAEDNQTIGALLDDIERLRDELKTANTATANAVAEAAAAEAELALHHQGDSADGSDALLKQVAELQAQLAEKEAEQERLSNTLENEQRKLAELERERELQNKSLQVLHQQLELERERNQKASA